MKGLLSIIILTTICLNLGASDRRTSSMGDSIAETTKLSLKDFTGVEKRSLRDAGHREQCSAVKTVKKCKEIPHKGRDIRFCVYKHVKKCTVMDANV